MSPTTAKPVPVPDERSAPFWEAAAEHRLTIARCPHCGTFQHPPTMLCPACLHPSGEFRFEPVSGRGALRSWTIVRLSLLPGFDDETPYLLADVELDEQADLRLIVRLLVDPDAPLAIGDRVVVDFDDRPDGVTVPVFRLASDVEAER